MSRRIRRHLSFANVTSLTALVFAMAGTGYALTIPKNSVGSKQIKKNAVSSKKVKNGSLKAVDFATGQLPAGAQGIQGIQGIRGLTGSFGAITVQRKPMTIADSTGTTGIQVECPAGTKIIGGGSYLDRVGTLPTPADDVQLIASRPANIPATPPNVEPPVNGNSFNSWKITYRNPSPGGSATGQAYAICAQT